MIVFLIVILVLAALLEFLSLRAGASCANVDFVLKESRTEPGEPIHLVTTVKNAGRLPVSYLCARIAFPLLSGLPEGSDYYDDRKNRVLSESCRLWGRQKLTRTVTFSIEKRGLHIVEGKDLKRGDFLGLRMASEPLYQRRKIMVYPRRLESPALIEALGSYCGEMAAQRWLIRDPILTLGIREYTGNEPMRTISWSQTARRGELMVREFDYTRSLNCCILLCINDLDEKDEPLLDRCCSIVRTVCEELALRGVEVSMFTNTALTDYRDAFYRSCTASLGKMEDLLDILACASSLECCSPEELLRACFNDLPEATAYVVVTPRRDREIEEIAALAGARTGLGTMVIAADETEE